MQQALLMRVMIKPHYRGRQRKQAWGRGRDRGGLLWGPCTGLTDSLSHGEGGAGGHRHLRGPLPVLNCS